MTNYISAIRQWFAVDLSRYNFFLMPLAFFRDFHTAQGIPLNSQEQHLLDYFAELKNDSAHERGSDFHLAIEIDMSILRAGPASCQAARLSNEPGAVAITLEEEDIREKYPWTYEILRRRLESRYSKFKQNAEYHQTRKALEPDARYCIERLLDPGNPRSGRKRFYNPNIVQEFDKKCTRR